MKTSTDLTTADRTAAAQRAATTLPIRAGLTNARAELFARTFAVWRMRAENGQGTNASSDLPTPSDTATTDAAQAQAAHDTAQRDAASADGAHRAWRQMVEQVAAGPSAPDVATAFVSRVMPVDGARTESTNDRTTEVDRAITDKGKDEKDAAASRRKDVMGASDTNAPVKDVNTLDPALRDRLDRVVTRMEQAGHTVTVTEAARSQPRQDALYAQGRTTPGPVVTWTRQSRHLDGLAVDVKVDGSYNNPEAYALLGKIANEEGLSTLGAKDPGHLELHADDALASLGQMATIKDAQITVEAGASRSSRMAQVAQVARVAQVAQVAQPAQVAQVAAVANPGVTTHAPASDAPTVFARAHNAPINSADIGRAAQPAPNTSINGGNPDGRIAQNAQAAAIAAALGSSATGEGAENAFTQGGQGGQRGRTALGGATATRADSVRAAITNMTTNALAGAMGTSGAKGPSMGGIGTSATRGAATAMRADEIQSLIESRDKQPVSRMLLTVDDEMGGVDRIRVDVRGSRVGAQMMFGENGDAQQAAGRVMELARALEQRGLAPDALKVANAAAGAATELARAAAPAAERGNSTATRQDDAGRSPHDQPRQRSRKEQGEPR